MSKRHLKRLIKKEKENYLAKFKEVENEYMGRGTPPENINNDFEMTEIIAEVSEKVIDSDSLKQVEDSNLSEKLKEWSIKHRVSRNCSKELIQILRSENLVVKPFYKFDCHIKPVVKNIAGGSYIHIGILSQLNKMSLVIQLPKNIILDINIDGLPLYKSSKTQLWPILLRGINIRSEPVFPIGIFLGKSKPSSCDEFLHKVVDELSFKSKIGWKLMANYMQSSV